VAQNAGQTGAAVAGKQAGTNLQSMGPKTTLTEECTKHSGHMVLFEDWQGKKVCEICYTDKSKKKDAETDKAAQDDLFKRLQAPAEEKDEEDEAEVKTQQQIVMDLHK
jgi:regulator of sigma D